MSYARAATFNGKSGDPCHWLDLDIPGGVQEKIEHRRPPAGNPYFLDEYIFAWQLVREWHMYRKFLSGIQGVKAAMLVCGRSHLPPFVRLLSAEHDVIPFCMTSKAVCAECYDCCKRSAMLDANVPTLNLPSKDPHVKKAFEAYCVAEKSAV